MRCYGPGRLGLIVCLVLAASSAQASPVSYSFTGTLQQPLDGSTQISGTLVYDTDLPTYPGITPSPGWSYYTGVPNDPTAPISSLTFQLGGETSSSFGTPSNLEVIVAHTATSDGFFIQEQFNGPSGPNVSAEFGLSNDNTAQPGPFTSSAPPSQLNLADFSIGSNLNVFGKTADGENVNIIGTITSLTPTAAVPEPSTALVFALLGGGLAFFPRAKATRKSRD